MLKCSHGVSHEDQCPACLQEGLTRVVAQSKGHGHVTPNEDGSRARCGGPGICVQCNKEFVRANMQAIRGDLEIENRYLKTKLTEAQQSINDWIAAKDR